MDYEPKKERQQREDAASRPSESGGGSSPREALRGKSYEEGVAHLKPAGGPVMRKAKSGVAGMLGAVVAGAAQQAAAALAQAESQDRVEKQGNQFEDRKDAIERLKDWAAGKKAYTSAQLLDIFNETTPQQRQVIYFGQHGILYKLLGTLSAEHSLRVMNLCGFPLQWKVKHIYTDAKPGIKRELMMRVVHNAPLGERADLARSKRDCELLQKHFPQDHPENLLGDGMRDTLYPSPITKGLFWALYPWYGKWADTTEKLDAAARWAYIATGPATKIPELKGKPALGGRNQWSSLLYWGPRGAALTADQIKSVDKAAADGALPLTDAFRVFEVRFNVPLKVPNLGDITRPKFKVLYDNFALLPPGTVNSDTLTSVTIKQDPKALGSYMDFMDSSKFGAIEYDTKAHTSLADLGHTVRHEMGHQTDTKYGGFTNLLSKAPGYFRKYKAMSGWLDELLEKMGAAGSVPLKNLLTAFMGKHNSFANPYAASPNAALKNLWQKVSDDYDKNDLKPSLDHLKNASKHSASGAAISRMLKLSRVQKYPANTPAFTGERYFGAHYGEYFSWHKDIDNARGPGHGRSAYTLAAPYETYADLYAAYFSTKTNRANNVPNWAADHFSKVASYGSRETQSSEDRPLTTGGGQDRGLTVRNRARGRGRSRGRPRGSAVRFPRPRVCATIRTPRNRKHTTTGVRMRCPACQNPLEHRVAGRFKLHVCPDCGGMWFVPGGLEAVLAASENDPLSELQADLMMALGDGDNVARVGAGGGGYRRCPVCDQFMGRKNWRHVSGVMVDCCMNHGTWLDGGRYLRLLAFERKGGAGRENAFLDREVRRPGRRV